MKKGVVFTISVLVVTVIILIVNRHFLRELPDPATGICYLFMCYSTERCVGELVSEKLRRK